MKKKQKIFVLTIILFVVSGIVAIPLKGLPMSDLAQKYSRRSAKISTPKFGLPDLDKDNIRLKYEGQELLLKSPVYIDINRYYLPVNDIVNELKGTVSGEGITWEVSINETTVAIDTEKNRFSKNGNDYALKKKALIFDHTLYISLFDFCKMFNLRTDWNPEKNMIALFRNREQTQVAAQPEGRPALIRLEDFVPNRLYANAGSLEKVRAIVDYLYGQNIPFHVAWVPRFVDPRPESKADNDISIQNSMENADFLFTLDYMIDKNGIIGLHGYTHQYGNMVSVKGYEFHNNYGDGIPDSEVYVRQRIGLAMSTARKLQIPYGFFEAPHYSISPAHLKIAEAKFNVIYQNYPGKKDGGVFTVKNSNRVVKYVPTPLGYVPGKQELNKITDKLRTLDQNTLASFYLHPFIEFEDIQVIKDGIGYPTYFYSENSALHRLVKSFQANGYKFKTINEL